MRIVRGPRPADHYTAVPNALLRDDRLSLRARGLLCLLLSFPPGWETDTVALSRLTTEGRDAVRTAMAELVKVGYVVRQRLQGSRGRWRTAIVVYDAPAGEHTTTEDGLPGVGQPGVGGPGVKVMKKEKKKVSQVMSSADPAVTPPAQPVHDRDHDLTGHAPEDMTNPAGRDHRAELNTVLADVPRDVRPGLTNAMRTVLDDAHSRGWSPHHLRDELANDRNDYSKCGPGALVARLRALSKTDPSATLGVGGDPWAGPCGDCDSTRHITTDDGKIARCPNCHPLARKTLVVTA